MRHLTCVHIIFYACGIYFQPPTHTALVSPVSNSMLLHAKFNITQGKAVFVFALSSLPRAEDTNHKKQGENTQNWSGNRFYRAGPNKWACVFTDWALKSQRRLQFIFVSQLASPLHHRDPWRSRKHVALQGGCVWILPATQRSSPWSYPTSCEVWSCKDLRGWKEYICSPSLKTFITMSKLVKLWFSEKMWCFFHRKNTNIGNVSGF